MPSEATKRVKGAINSAHQQFKLEESERNRLNTIRKTVDSFFVKKALDCLNSGSSIYQCEIFKNIANYKYRSQETMKDTDTESKKDNFSQKAKHLESPISFAQTKINYLKHPGQNRVVGGKAKKYRPDKNRRREIDQLETELTELTEVRQNIPDSLVCPAMPMSRSNSKIDVKRRLSEQIGLQPDDEESLEDNFAKVLLIGVTANISLAEGIKEANADTELKALREDIIDKKFAKLFQNDLKVDMGLVFVASKLAVLRSLREWVSKDDRDGGDAVLAKQVQRLGEQGKGRHRLL